VCSSDLGKKKQAQIIAAAKERNVVILNVKEVKAPVEEEAEAEAAEEKPSEEQKAPVEKAEKPKKSKKAAKTEEDAEE